MKKKLLDEASSLKDAGSEEKDLKKEAAEALEEMGKQVRIEALQTRGNSDNEQENQKPIRNRRTLAESLDLYFAGKQDLELKKLAFDQETRQQEILLRKQETEHKEKELEIKKRAQALEYMQITGERLYWA
jgi:hypothetical protein